MDKPPQSRAPVILAIVLLLLPVLYVGSYFALVVPRGRVVWHGSGTRMYLCNYRIDNQKLAAAFFWPLEQIDRKVRPGAWERANPFP